MVSFLHYIHPSFSESTNFQTEMVTTRSQKEVFKQLAEGRLVDGANCDNAEPTSSSNIAQRMRVGKRSNDDIFALSDDVKKAPIQAERCELLQDFLRLFLYYIIQEASSTSLHS